MVVEVERTVDVEASVEDAWAVLSDPEQRARAIDAVESYAIEGSELVWQVALPVIGKTVSVRTRDVQRDPPRFVRFTGTSRVMRVEGEHELESIEGGTRVRSRFTVDGKLPGVERYFERRVDDEIRNLVAAIDVPLKD